MERLLDEAQPSSVLDPFARYRHHTTYRRGQRSEGHWIEIIPVGVLTGNAIALAANGLRLEAFGVAAQSLLRRVASRKEADRRHAFRHVRITESLSPWKPRRDSPRPREYISGVDNPDTRAMLNLACMSVLESVSYTRRMGNTSVGLPIGTKAESSDTQRPYLAILGRSRSSPSRNVGGHGAPKGAVRQGSA